MTEIAPGSLVTLKSGGPKLTVEVVHSDQKVSVSWFVNNEYQFVTIPVVAVHLAQ
ncbi:MAG: DUF2158 domain-containing protein [Alcaligenes pakistanensis]|uniref:DUF2158 domain-containing protein n=1 Tax=Alcaligenes pakistanensis TaxID=1482717 RepID=UPI000EDBAE15|nr:hypothetical protein [Alcaligenes faecalis]